LHDFVDAAEVIGIDTESTFTRGRDIRSLGAAAYVSHPDTQHVLVAAYGHGYARVAQPHQFPWAQIAGFEWVSHNRSYDKLVLDELRARGQPVPQPSRWHCSADLCAWIQSPRALDEAARELLGIVLEKETRNQLRDIHWPSLSDAKKVALANYCLLDAKTAFLLWKHFGDQWPENERQISEHTTLMCHRGIGIDPQRLAEDIQNLQVARWKTSHLIPWAGELDAKGKIQPVTSTLALAKHCRDLNIEPPPATDIDSEELAAWLKIHPDQKILLEAFARWRSINRLLQLLRTMEERTDQNNTLHYSLKYFGALTGRWSGEAGLNLLNLSRERVAGVDVRALFTPRGGKIFVVADLSQIEARTALWLAGDQRLLSLLGAGMDLYEAYARERMGYKDPAPLATVNPKLRAAAKVAVLSGQYSVGAAQYRRSMKNLTGSDIGPLIAEAAVRAYRQANPKITGLWNQLLYATRQSAGDSLVLELPSGRTIHYFDVAERNGGGRYSARTTLGGPFKNLHAGVLTENLASGMARDIFALAILKIESAGIPVLLHVHDEVLCEVDQTQSKEALNCVLNILREAPPWARGLPLEASGRISHSYAKIPPPTTGPK
jgi:hypothetical protein